MKGKLLIGLFLLMGACLDDDIISFEEQKRRDVAKIDQYLADNAITDVIADASGLRMVVSQIGTGMTPNMGNDIKIVYSGRLFSGEVFDAGVDPALGKLGDYIRGWQIGFQMLPKGSIATLYIPSVYGYGGQGNGIIPANANLIFDVELQSVTPTAEQNAKLASDGTAIDTYLASKPPVTAITHSSGVRYEILTPGTGTAPGLYDQISVNYTGKIIPTEVEFGAGIVEPSLSNSCRVINFIQGWHIGLPLLKEGGKIRMYIPSGLAYGNIEEDNIPANSNLFFEVELLDVVE